MQTGCTSASYFIIFLVGLKLNLALSGCGRIEFEQLATEERPNDRESDASDAKRSDARPRLDTGIRTAVDADIDASTDAASAMDSEAADTESAFDADEDSIAFDADEEVEEQDATSDANESDAISPSDVADDANEEGCVLSGISYTQDEIAELSGTLSIRAAHSDKCAAVNGDSVDWGASVVQQNCDYSTGQLWEPLDLGEGWYALRSPVSGHCVEPNGRDTSEGVVVGLWDCWLPDTQQVRTICVANDQWRIVNRASDLSLSVLNASDADGTEFVGHTDQGEANQRFRIESQADVFMPVVPTAEHGSGATWRYWTESQPTGWTDAGFDDSEWSEGPGGFGEGSNRGVIGTPWNTSDIWMRISFELSDPLPSSASLRVYHDENVDVYINGVLAFSATGWISGYRQFELDSAANAALVVGDNVLAVHCSNSSAPQFIDVGFGSYAWDPD